MTAFNWTNFKIRQLRSDQKERADGGGFNARADAQQWADRRAASPPTHHSTPMTRYPRRDPRENWPLHPEWLSPDDRERMWQARLAWVDAQPPRSAPPVELPQDDTPREYPLNV